MDLDTGDNGQLEYSLVDSDLYQEFHVNSCTGLLIITKPLDREKVLMFHTKNNFIMSMDFYKSCYHACLYNKELNI